MLTDSTTIALGGIGTSPDPEATALEARRYQHPALPGRVVVRLVPSQLGEVEDLRLGTQGFTSDGGTRVGYVRKRAIGFPAWPIITDPGNARHALNLVADLRRAEKLAKSKPGQAADRIDALAKTLDGSAPHFLPTFYEEASRIFLGVDNQRYGLQYFNKARQVERTHNIPIDEGRHRQALLEFALAGALSAKELTAESKALLQRLPAQEALEVFLKLNVDRTLGGLPPYAGLATDLRRIAKAAGANPLETEIRLLQAIIHSPALAKAPGGFWTGYAKSLVALATSEPEAREALIQLAPTSVAPDAWIDILDGVGIVEDLRSGAIDARDWAERYIKALLSTWNPGYPRKLANLIRQLPGLKGQPIELGSGYGLEPELLDALLEAGAQVSVAINQLRVRNWIECEDRCDLAFLADSEHAALVQRQLGEAAENHLETILASPGARRMLGHWAKPRFSKEPTIVEVWGELERLAPVFKAAGRAAFPEQVADFAAQLLPEKLLAGALRDGFLTEYTWPAMERAIDDLGGQVTFHEAWPAIGVAANGRVIWVDGEEWVAEASFTLANGIRPEWWKYLLVDGVTACRARLSNHGDRVIWSNDPTTQTKAEDYFWGSEQSFAVPAGRLVGARVVRVGDPDPFADHDEVLSDGQHYWVSSDTIREVDPETGKTGRKSLPSAVTDLVTDWLRDGWTIESVRWVPATATTMNSPLTTVNGVHGALVLDHDDHPSRRLLADGTEIRIGTDRMVRPGGGHWLVMGLALHGPDGKELLEARVENGHVHPFHSMPLSGWHQLRVRDAAASERLRGIKPEEVTELLAAAPTTCAALPKRWEATRPENPLPELTPEAKAAAQRLLGSDDEALVHSVAWTAFWVKRIVAEAKLRVDSSGQTQWSFPEWAPSLGALGWFGRTSVDRGSIQAVADCLNGQPVRLRAPGLAFGVAAVRPEVLVACVARPGAGQDVIGEAAAAFGAIVDAGLYSPQACVFECPRTEGPAAVDSPSPDDVVETPTGPAVLLEGRSWTDWYYLSPAGGVPTKAQDRGCEKWLSASEVSQADCVLAFERLLAQGPPQWDPQKAERLAEGLGCSRAAAALLLAGMPGFDTWEANFLPKPVREELGLKVAEAKGAREFLKHLNSNALVALISVGAADPMRVAMEGLDVEAMITYWQAEHGSEVTLPDDLLAEADKEFPYRGAHYLARLAEAPQGYLSSWLWLAARLDRGDALAPWLADRLDVMRQAYESPEQWTDHAREVRKLLGLPKHLDAPQSIGAWTLTPNQHGDELLWDPAKVTDWEAEAALIAALNDGVGMTWLRPRVAVLSGAFDEIQADLRSGRAGAPQDPCLSAPETVAEVVDALELPEASARYWLQLLALANPTDRNIDAWNGWKKADRTKAVAPLLERELVMEAKRARAGRSYFLPGGWLEATAPHLPMEMWKATLYDLRDGPKVAPRYQVVVPTVPLGTLFAEAWARYRDGDVPGYTKLKTKRYRRR